MTPLGLCLQLACIWEATARKPGNVHRWRDFDDLGYVDFLACAAAIAPVLERSSALGVGPAVLQAVQASAQVTSGNANLGIILLLAPLAAVPREVPLQVGIEAVLEGLTVEDSRAVFAAIRLASPGGLGEAQTQDVRNEPTWPLRPIMALAAERDLVARQYARGFREVFDEGLPALLRAARAGAGTERAIIACQLHLLARHPDSLIARKRGLDEALEASRRASQVCGWERGLGDWSELETLDAWLRQGSHARNPGTTADLVAACLFAALREGWLTPRWQR